MDVEALWIEASLKRRKILVCNVYRPPDSQSTWMDSLEVMLERAGQDGLPVFLLGDFNCDMSSSTNAVRLEELLSDYRLCQLVIWPTTVTAISATQTVLFFTSDLDLVRDVGGEELGLSDHSMILKVEGALLGR